VGVGWVWQGVSNLTGLTNFTEFYRGKKEAYKACEVNKRYKALESL